MKKNELSIGHAPASLSTFPAHFSAFFAVIMGVFVTFCSAGLANIGTYSAELASLAAAYTHKPGGSIANYGTFHIELNAAGHHGQVFFVQAGRSAIIAGGSTPEASLYAVFIIFVSHRHSLKTAATELCQ